MQLHSEIFCFNLVTSSRSPRWRGGCVARANFFFVSVLYTPHLINECLSVLRERHLLCGSSGGFFYFFLRQSFYCSSD